MVRDITEDVPLQVGSVQSRLASASYPIHDQRERELKTPGPQGQDKDFPPLPSHSAGSPTSQGSGASRSPGLDTAGSPRYLPYINAAEPGAFHTNWQSYPRQASLMRTGICGVF